MKVEMPDVHILPEVFEKVMFWVDNCDKEISGWGKVVVEDGGYCVVDAFLLDQEVSATTTDIDAESLGKLMAETIKDEGHLNWWWHSHVNMGVSWSGTDTDTIEEFGSNGMCLATVFNKKRNTRTAFYQAGDDFLPQIFVDDIDLIIAPRFDQSLEADWKKQMEDKVRIKTYNQVKPGKPSTTNHGGTNTSTKGVSSKSSYYDSMTGHTVWSQIHNAWVHPSYLQTAQGQSELPDWYTIAPQEKRKWGMVYKAYMGVEPPSNYCNELKEFYYEWAEVSDVDQLLAWERA